MKKFFLALLIFCSSVFAQPIELPPYTGFTVVEYVLFQHYEYGVRITAVSPTPSFELDPGYFHFLRAISDDGREVVWGGSPNPVWGEPYQQYGNLTASIDWTDYRTPPAEDGYGGFYPGNPQGFEPPPRIRIHWSMRCSALPNGQSAFFYSIESSNTLDNWERSRDCPWSYGSSGNCVGEYEDAWISFPFKQTDPQRFFRVRQQSSKTWEVYIEEYYIDGYMPTKYE